MTRFAGATWGEGLLDSETLDWMRRIHAAAPDGLVVEVLVHSTDPTPTAKCEFFTCPNGGTTIQSLLSICKAEGFHVCLTLDPHLGNGRDEAGGSGTGPGRYQYSMAEGGIDAAVNKIMSWPSNLLEPVIAFQFPNEPPKWMAGWIRDNFIARNAAKIRSKGWFLVGDARAEHLAAYGDELDVLDPHLLFRDEPDAVSAVRSLRAAYPDKRIWVSEATADRAVDTLELMRDLYAAGAELVGMFTGHTLGAFTGDSLRWNSKTYRPHFVALTDGGPTTVGREIEDFWGIDQEPPVEPPPDPPDPPDPPEPPSEVNLERIRLQNVHARGRIDAGKPEVAKAILERQARELGIE